MTRVQARPTVRRSLAQLPTRAYPLPVVLPMIDTGDFVLADTDATRLNVR